MKLLSALIVSLAACSLAGCSGLYGHDEVDRYAQRADTITMSAGDAKEVNARAHMVTPWPREVGDRRIPAQGERVERAMNRYYRRSQEQKGAPSTVINVNANAVAGTNGQQKSDDQDR
jgi:hypothetical protein